MSRDIACTSMSWLVAFLGGSLVVGDAWLERVGPTEVHDVAGLLTAEATMNSTRQGGVFGWPAE